MGTFLTTESYDPCHNKSRRRAFSAPPMQRGSDTATQTLHSEVGNALIAGFRRRRLTVEAVLRAWAGYQKVRVRLAEIDVRSALQIALESGLYGYDASVLETARAARLPVLTLDRGVARAARRLGLKLVEVGM